MSLQGGAHENHTPNTGRQTPNPQRRPLQRISLNTAVLSPTKRRKQCHAEESTAAVVDVLKPGAFARDDALPLTPAGSPGKPERHRTDVLWEEIFSRLCARDLVGDVAPVSRLWHEMVHSKELWAILRPHMRLVDQLLISEKVVERRSKGRLFRCRRLGTGEVVLLRVVDLELTNAGKDDGVPTSFLREAALLSKLRHPNIIRHLGSEILGKRAVMCTEFVHENFSAWYKRLETRSAHEKCLDIRIKFSQVLTGLSHVHRQGVMHRNLKPDNIFIDLDGVIKLGDFTTTRMLDIPIQAYTPEDPKERDRSGREMRRLWYRAPELILRDEVYGPKVDTWSVGCLLAEAATGRSLFQSDSEIDHLFRVFRLLGTPTKQTWPEVLTMRNFSPKFPIYPGIKLTEVTRAVCLGSEADLDSLMNQAQPDRSDVLQNMLSVAAVLGADGMMVLDQLVTVPPSARAGASEILEERFFRSQRLRSPDGSVVDRDLRVSNWLHGRPWRSLARDRLRPTASIRPELSSEMRVEESGGEDIPPVTLPSNLASSEMVWSIMNVMRQNEKQTTTDAAYSEANEGDGPGDRKKALPQLPPGFDSNQRAKLVDFIIGLASTLSLTDYTLHLAVGLLNKYLALQDECLAQERMQVAGATCLKVADVFAEQSKEYYKQENASEYAEATLHQALPEQMLAFEKTLLPKLEFDLHVPTTHWFVHCYLAYGRFNTLGSTAKTAFFIGDLTLLDYDLLAYAPSLRAQCAVLLAVFLVQQAQSQRQRRQDGASWTNASQDLHLSQPTLSQSLSQAGQPQPGDGDKHITLTYFEHWDTFIRNQVCQGNTSIDTALCLQAIVRTLVVLRREWKSAQLTAVEAKHASVVRTLVYPERFPVSKLVRYILPDKQRGLVPE